MAFNTFRFKIANFKYQLKLLRFESMPKDKKKGEGFHSAAGLIRYFDSEDEKALKVDPWLVIGLCIGLTIVVEIAIWQW